MSSSSDRHRAVVSNLWTSFFRRLGISPRKISQKLGVPAEDIRQLQEPSQASTTARTRNQLITRLVDVIPDDEESAARLLVAVTKSPRDVAKVLDRQLQKLESQEQRIRKLTSMVHHKNGDIYALQQNLLAAQEEIERLKQTVVNNTNDSTTPKTG